MLVALLVAVLVLVAAVVGGSVLLLRRDTYVPPAESRDSLMVERCHERFLVTTLAGRTFNGLLAEVDDRTLVLLDCSVLKDDGAAVVVDGQVLLRRDAVAYMQKP